jgi:hypothetical protein
MGAWGYGVFEDDQSSDLMYEIIDSNDVHGFCLQALDAASDASYLEYDEGIAVSVSAAIVDSVLHKTAYRYYGFPDVEDDPDGTVGYMNWINGQDAAAFEPLKSKVVQALILLLSENSELCELWSENEELFPKWKDIYEQIIGRMSA